MTELVGQVLLNRYKIIKFLGRGGMAEVYKVWDQQRGVFLAMKVLHGDLAEDKVFLRRFRHEAKTLAELQHPHIVRFYGLGQEDRLSFMLMDYVEGHPLRQEIFGAPGPLPLTRILEVMQPVCVALHYAHSQGFAHCDVKPANILIEKSGRVLLADFGIARKIEAATATLVGAGAPAYMAPEQVRGEDPIPQMDIYALGIMLFEMLTGGERPFTGERAHITGSTNEKIRWEQIHSRPPSPRKFNPNISPDLEAVVLKCLEKEPGKRYQSALELLNALGASIAIDGQRVIVEGEPIIPPVPPIPSPLAPSRHQLGLPLTLGITFLIIIGLLSVGSRFLQAQGKGGLLTERLFASSTPTASMTFTSRPTFAPTPTFTPIPTATLIATTAPPTQPSNSEPAFDSDNPEGFIYWYFDAICSLRNYQYMWQFMTEKFKTKNSPGGFDEYVRAWDANQKVIISSITYVGTYQGTLKYRVNMTIYYKREGFKPQPLVVNYYLFFDQQSGHWVFDRPEAP